MHIHEATLADLAEVQRVEREAFGSPVESELVGALLDDPSAQPTISLLAEKDGRAVGHVLFTRAEVLGAKATVMLLAPLAVVPAEQGRGVGGALVDAGLAAARDRGAVAVFVLGHPGYYPRFGFVPAHVLGLLAPYPIPDEVADAWMVAELVAGAVDTLRGTVAVADELMKPEYWRE